MNLNLILKSRYQSHRSRQNRQRNPSYKSHRVILIRVILIRVILIRVILIRVILLSAVYFVRHSVEVYDPGVHEHVSSVASQLLQGRQMRGVELQTDFHLVQELVHEAPAEFTSNIPVIGDDLGVAASGRQACQVHPHPQYRVRISVGAGQDFPGHSHPLVAIFRGIVVHFKT